MAVLALLLGVLAGCGLRNVLPGPAVSTGRDRATFEVAAAPRTADGAALVYMSGPAVPYPVLPLQVWGLRYALDLVLVSDHPDWVMHEYARIDLPHRQLWLAKDAGRDREQTITADIEDIASWVPEVPVRRKQGKLLVEDTSTATTANLHFSYTNPLGQPVDVRYSGPLPIKPSQPRNGNTMGHSRASVAALLDLYAFRIGGKATVTIDGQARKLHKLAGLLPEAYLLAQVQGGFAITDFSMRGMAESFAVGRPWADEHWPTHDGSLETWTVGTDGWAERPGPVTTLRYHFVEGELDRAQVLQHGADQVLVNVVFNPRVPDVRRRFSGVSASRFVVDINGQPGHGTGCFATGWAGNGLETRLQPDAPRWFADRALVGTIQYKPDDTTWVSAWRRDLETEPPCGQ